MRKVLVARAAEIARELYLAIVLDRAKKLPLIMLSAEGGIDIEQVAKETPERIVRRHIPLEGLRPYQARALFQPLLADGKQVSQAADVLRRFAAFTGISRIDDLLDEVRATTIIKAKMLGSVRFLSDERLLMAQRRHLELDLAGPELARVGKRFFPSRHMRLPQKLQVPRPGVHVNLFLPLWIGAVFPGQLLADEAASVLQSLADLDAVVADLRDGRLGSLSVSYFASAGAAWIPPVVAALEETLRGPRGKKGRLRARTGESAD